MASAGPQQARPQTEGQERPRTAPAPQKERTKVAVRRLPHSLPEETFRAAVNSVVDSSQYTWLSFVPGKRK